MYLLISGTYEIKELTAINAILLPPNSEAADLILKHNEPQKQLDQSHNFEVDVESHVILRWIRKNKHQNR